MPFFPFIFCVPVMCNNMLLVLLYCIIYIYYIIMFFMYFVLALLLVVRLRAYDCSLRSQVTLGLTVSQSVNVYELYVHSQ
jgi:hypothetical protein